MPAPSNADAAARHRLPDAALALAVAAALTVIVLSAPVQRVHGARMIDFVRDVTDDALFYPQIARNLAHGAGSTLNGVTPTNGYQPLWGALLVPLARVFDDRVTLLRAAIALGAALLAGAMTLAAGAVRRAGSSHAWGAVLCLGAGVGALGTWLSEAHLSALLCVALVARTLSATARDGDRASLADGALCGLVVLARLDQVLFALAAIGSLHITRGRPRATALTLAAAAAVVAPYLAWNLLRFGHAAPIASAIRVHHGAPHLMLARLGGSGAAVLALAAVTTAAIVWKRPPEGVRRACVPLFGAVLAHAVIVATLSSMDRVPNWYWAQGVAFVAVFGPIALASVDRLRATRALHAAVLTALAGVVPVGLSLSRRLGPSPRGRLALVAWAAENVPPRQRVFVCDSPGILAYWTDMRVIAADGLTADFAFQRALRERGVTDTLRSLGVGYVLYADDGIGAWFPRRVRRWARPYEVSRLIVASTVHSTTSVLALRASDEVSRLDLRVGEIDIAVLWRLPEGRQGPSMCGGSTLGSGEGL